MNNIYINFIFTKLGSGVFLIYLVISLYFLRKGDLNSAALWLRLSEAYITYNAASYLLTGEKSQSLPQSNNKLINLFNWILNNFFSRKVFVLIMAMILINNQKIDIAQLFEIGIFMLGGRMVEKFSRGIQHEMQAQQTPSHKRISVHTDEEEGEA